MVALLDLVSLLVLLVIAWGVVEMIRFLGVVTE